MSYNPKTEQNFEKGMTVVNRGVAQHQITAEKIIKDAHDVKENTFIATDRTFASQEEIIHHQTTERKRFESKLDLTNVKPNSWYTYAAFEAKYHEFDRCRSIFERLIEAEQSRNPYTWKKYANTELQFGFVDRSRNIYERATKILPKEAQLWLDWIILEKNVNNIDNVRTIYNNFIKTNPSVRAWDAYCKFEVSCGNIEGCRRIYQDYVQQHPYAETYIKYATFEQKQGNISNARLVYQRALKELEMDGKGIVDDNVTITDGIVNIIHIEFQLYKSYAEFEVAVGEYNKARIIYKHALSLINAINDKQNVKSNVEVFDPIIADEFPSYYVNFEKQFGDSDHMISAFSHSQEKHYENLLEKDSKDYNVWMDYIKFKEQNASEVMVMMMKEEREKKTAREMVDVGYNPDHTDSVGDSLMGLLNENQETIKEIGIQMEMLHNPIRALYKRAVANKPNPRNLDIWQRYIYLWLNYAAYEELVANNIENASSVMRECLSVLPHKYRIFSKVWIYACHLNIRMGELTRCRSLFGQCIGLYEKFNKDSADDKYNVNNTEIQHVFEEYISLEFDLQEFDRCRDIFKKMLELLPFCQQGWITFANTEALLGDYVRARSIFTNAIDTFEGVDCDEIWSSYIAMELATEPEQGESEDVHQSKKWNYITNIFTRRIGIAHVEYNSLLSQYSSDNPNHLIELNSVKTVDMKAVYDSDRVIDIYTEQIKFYFEHNTPDEARKVISDAIEFYKKQCSIVEDQYVKYSKDNRFVPSIDLNNTSDHIVIITPGTVDPLFVLLKLKEHRKKIIEVALECETNLDSNNHNTIEKIKLQLPTYTKRSRKISIFKANNSDEDMNDANDSIYNNDTVATQEYIDYVFPDDISKNTNLTKLQALAKRHKTTRTTSNYVSIKNE